MEHSAEQEMMQVSSRFTNSIEIKPNQIVVEQNIRKEYSQTRCIHQEFEVQVERTPDAIAVLYEMEQMTYRELNQRANQLAHYLQTLGVGPEVLVGIYMERSLEMIVGLLSILKAGGAYVPLDSTYPQERLTFMMHDAHISVLLTQKHMLERFIDHNIVTVCLDNRTQYIDRQSTDNLTSSTLGQNLAYVIYTSGSTGKPKGVSCGHSGVLNLLADFQSRQPIFIGDNCSFWTSCSFDVSVYEIFSALLAGGTLHIVPERVRSEGPKFIEWLYTQQIHSTYIPPFLLADLRSWLEQQDKVPHLRRLLVGVEPISEQTLTEINTYIPELHIINGYGPTEASICATLYSVISHNAQVRNTPIGQPVQNTQVYLLDSSLRPVPIGNAGELYIGGTGLARGYFHRADLTAERFIPDPFSSKPGARLYKTGDKARYLSDGNIEFLGRVDRQIKIRGFRIELGEIEATLASHPLVKGVAVELREGARSQKQLVAYLVTHLELVPSVKELRNFLQEHMPEYMVPSVFILLEAFPLTPNGKLDRHALPAPERTGMYVAPRSSIEKTLAEIWSQVLGLEQVGVFDNFFELGGHSLLATQFISRLREAFQVELPLRSLFKAPTIADLAGLIERDSGSKQRPSLPPIASISRKDNLPLSFSQERVWFLQHLDPANRSYHFQATLRFKGSLNVRALERCLGEIMRRHESLRTTFGTVNGQPVEIIHDAQLMHLSVVDLEVMPDYKRQAKAQQCIEEELQKPFDLTQLPLIRWTLLRLGEQEHILVHVEHHIIHDGWSFNLFLGELQILYTAFSQGLPSPLSDLAIQFADFASWQRQWMQGEVAETQLAHWKKKLADSPPLLNLPIDRQRPAIQRFQGASQRVELPLELCESLRAFSRCQEVTLFMAMFAVFATLLYRYTGQDDICIGSGIANRRLRETEGLIGMIINTLVLRTDLSGNPSFREFLQRVRELTLEAYVHQDLPFEKIVEILQPDRDTSYNPLFQVMFGFHDSPLPSLVFPGLSLELTEGLSNGSAKFDLSLIIIPRSEQRIGQIPQGETQGITMIWEYNSDLFEEETIHRMCGHYQTLLESITDDPKRCLSDLPIMTKDEINRQIIEWNATSSEYLKETCIHKLFEAQVEQSPDAVAVIFENEYLTYRELNERANQLAHHLQSLGIGPDVLAGVYIDRSILLIVGLLGILKAGGAYVPLDLAYPRERLSFILKDTRLPVLLTQERLRQQLPKHGAQEICIDADWEVIAEQSTENPISRVRANNLIYVIYTSGSTGQPKGVCVPHSAVNRLVCNTNYVSLEPTDCVAQASNSSFDAATFEIWGALLHGARLVVITKDVMLSPQNFAKHILEQEITTLFLTTALFNQLASEVPWIFRSLHHLLFGGEAVDPKWVKEVLKYGPHQRLLHVYGPTESTTFSTWYLVQDVYEGARTIPIGRPISNTQIYLLDEQMQPVPIGVSGELYIGGDGLARGYLDRPELTAERFVPHPFSNESGAILYRTGDIARYLVDGTIEFLGRKDGQVKVRGFRVEMGEVEIVLSQHPTVQKALVLALGDHPSEKHLVAYIVLNKGCTITRSNLRDFLQSKLPDYAIPATFVFVDTFPLTSNGKIDHSKLPPPAESTKEVSHVPPRNTLEVQIAQIFEAVLNTRLVSVKDDFFLLGGNSLSAMRVISQLQKHFGRSISLSVLFQEATVEHLARFLSQQKNSDRYSPLVGIQPNGSKPPFFCVHPAGGDVFCYVELAHHLGSDQPLYAFEASFLSEIWPPMTRVEDMARLYVEALLAHQTHGPYFLGGYSSGGTVAFEMAQLLHEQGHEVALLALLDTISPLQNISQAQEDDTQIITWFAHILAMRWSGLPKECLPSLLSEEQLRHLSINEQWLYFLEVAKAVNYVSPDDGFSQLQRQVQIYRQHALAAQSYKPKKIYSGHITLFRVSKMPEGIQSYRDYTSGWDKFSFHPIKTYNIPGDHNTLLNEPYVQVLAESLKGGLDLKGTQ